MVKVEQVGVVAVCLVDNNPAEFILVDYRNRIESI